MEHSQKWGRRNGYNFSPSKAEKIYQSSSDLIAVFPKDDSTKTLIRQAVTMLNTASQTVEALRLKIDQTAATLPEYPVVMAMNGVGPSLGPQLMAEIGDVIRFTHREALIAFAGVDPGKNDSGKRNQKSVRTSKKGSPRLRKTLFQIMDGLIKRSPVDDPIYAFMDKKRPEDKPYYVYMTAEPINFSVLLRTGTGIPCFSGRIPRKLISTSYYASDQRTAVVLLRYPFFNLYKIFKVH